MKKLSVEMAVVLALVPSFVGAGAGTGLDLAHPRGVALAFDVIPACRLPVGVTSYSNQKEMPYALRNAVEQELGDLVSPDSPFDATDVVVTGHNRRLIFVWVREHRWIVATERGGRGYNDPIVAYEVSANGQKAALIAERIAMPGSVCTTAEELLNQRAPTKPFDSK